MAISVTSDLTDISACNSTTDGGTHYRLQGTTTANPAADSDTMVQGSACIANKLGATTGVSGGHFNRTSTFNATGKHIIHWRHIVTAGNMRNKADGGIQLGLTTLSTTTTTNWALSNARVWNLDGKDTVPVAQGWVPYVVDPSTPGDVTYSGTFDLTVLKNVGMLCSQVSSVTSTVSNQFYDAIRMGSGLTATASSSADTITLSSIFSVDSSSANGWGILTQNAGIYYASMKLTIGSTSQTNTCSFSDSNQVLVWRNQRVADDLFEIKLLGASGNKTTFTLTECVVRGQSGKTWGISCDSNSDFKGYSCSFSNILLATLSSGSVLDGCSISASTTLDLNGALVTGCTFVNSKLKLDAASDADNLSLCTFQRTTTGHAIEITAAGTYDFDHLTFTGYASTNGSTGNEAVYVNLASGSVTINVNGGNTPSIRTAGATVTVISGVVTVEVDAATATGTAVQNANVYLAASSGGPMPYQASVTIANSGTTATVTHTGHPYATNDKVLIEGASHAANNGVFTITVTGANTYTYTMASSPGSNPTGTIRSTFVLLKGLTDVNGVISMTRSFSSNQPVTGWARKSSSAPYYKTALLSGTVSSAAGATLTALMVPDE